MIEVLKPGPVCVDVEGLSLTEHERGRLRHPMTGMVILFTRNYRDREQLRALCDEIHAVRPGILISVDHEGGRVQRFRSEFTDVPAMSEIAAHEDAEARFEAAGLVLAAELRACGVDFTFAPVLDVDYGRSAVIGSRSLGTTPELVTAHAAALIRGLRRGGMASCGKHFPGHGWAEADSHTALPEDERDAESLMRDMLPYGKLPELASVMTAHVAYHAFEGEVATFSRRLLQDELREPAGLSRPRLLGRPQHEGRRGRQRDGAGREGACGGLRHGTRMQSSRHGRRASREPALDSNARIRRAPCGARARRGLRRCGA